MVQICRIVWRRESRNTRGGEGTRRKWEEMREKERKARCGGSRTRSASGPRDRGIARRRDSSTRRREQFDSKSLVCIDFYGNAHQPRPARRGLLYFILIFRQQAHTVLVLRGHTNSLGKTIAPLLNPHQTGPPSRDDLS